MSFGNLIKAERISIREKICIKDENNLYLNTIR